MNLTPDKLAAAAGIDSGVAARWADALNAAMSHFSINTPRRAAHFIAQLGHESAGFRRVVENLNYSAERLAAVWPARFAAGNLPNDLARSIARNPEAIANSAYGGRMGNDKQGDGWRYRGRGLIMLTGKDSYKQASDATGIDLIGHPDYLETTDIAAMVAGWYWSTKGLNSMADIDNLEGITRRINGGTIGMDDRRARYARAAKVLA
jgi:putative chitinase